MRRADIEVPNTPVDVNSWGVSACYPRGSFYTLSDGFSTQYRRITKPDFRLCSTCQSRSQAPFCLCTLRMVSIHSECTFGRLRYSLGGPPQSNCPPDTVHPPAYGAMLEFQQQKSGIPTVTPHKPKPMVPSLPPILCISYRNPISGYSKALRGLSVQSRVMGIFTHTSISPGPLLRQRSRSLHHSCGS